MMGCRAVWRLKLWGDMFRWLFAVAFVWFNAVASVHAQTTESLFTTQTPALPSASDGVAYELGMKFQVARSGQITAIRYWKATGDSGTHVGRIWSTTGTLLSSVTFSGETASGWQQQSLTTALAVQANTTYVVSVNIVSNYPFTNGGLASPIVNGDISSLADGNNGVFGGPSAFPISSFQSSNYFRDIVFVPDTVGVPAKLALAPATSNTQTGVPVSYTATIQDANGNTVATASNAISFAVSGVSGSFNPVSPVTASAGKATSAFTPATTGTATITVSATGLTSASATLTVATAAGSPQSLFTTQTPAIPSAADGVPYELGMKFRLAGSGVITAIRYWKASGDTGTHVGRIWSSTGSLLASTTFAGETASGWQQQALATPLSVQPGTTYVVSVNIGSRYPFTGSGLANPIVNGEIGSVADGNNGVYGNPFAFPTLSFQNSNYFRDIVFVPDAAGPPAQLSLAPANSSGQTNSAVTYTATVQDASGNTVVTATNSIVFTVSGVSGFFNPGSGETPITPTGGVATTSFTPTSAGSATITASSQALASATVTLTVAQGPAIPTQVRLLPAIASTQTGVPVTYSAQLQDANGNTVTTATNPVTFTVSGVSGSFSPASPVTASAGVATSSLAPTTPGTATVAASVAGLTSATATLTVTGNATLAPESLFTTQTPVLPDASDGGTSYELGMKFQVARSGKITGIRYWKSPSDTGTHIGTIWSASGTMLASATFTGETSSGWQQQLLATPLSVQANTTYLVSVNIASHYPFTGSGLATSIVNMDISSVADGANGVFGSPGTFPTQFYQSSNYFRDIVFVPDAIATITKFSGDNQAGTAGSPLPNPFVVLIRDPNNNPQANVSVTFAIRSGAGSVSPATATTDSTGEARTTLTLGSSGLTTVGATAAGIGSVTFNAFVPNATYSENQQPGTTAWNITNPVSDVTPEVAGFASAPSVNKGGTLDFKVSLAQPGQYTINVYRLGYYGGSGGRLVGSFGPFSGVTQSPCNVTDPQTLLIECNWDTSFMLAVGANWTSGLYVANLTAQSSGKQSQIWFVVRDDSSQSNLLFQSSFNTFLAYNNYGDAEQHSLYEYNSTNGQRAYKVSFDRPFGAVTLDPDNPNNMTRYERNMARWLESQGYDVTYTTSLDVHLNPSLLLQHRAYLSVGHDEYWSLETRNGVEQARDAGVNLGFFSGNSAYWRVRFEPSSTGTPNRVMVCYKDPAVGDPVAPTYLWRGPENNRPENALLGVMYVGDNDFSLSGGYDYVVSNATDAYYNNTGLANNAAVLQLVGYEWDAVVNNGSTPPGLVVLSSSPTNPFGVAPDLPPGTNSAISNAARYTAASGGKVFAGGSIQFVWGLDSDGVSPPRADFRMQQFVVNVLSDLGARPITPSSGLIVP